RDLGGPRSPGERAAPGLRASAVRRVWRRLAGGGGVAPNGQRLRVRRGPVAETRGASHSAAWCSRQARVCDLGWPPPAVPGRVLRFGGVAPRRWRLGGPPARPKSDAPGGTGGRPGLSRRGVVD